MADFSYGFDELLAFVSKMDNFFLTCSKEDEKLRKEKEQEILKAGDTNKKFVASLLARNKQQFIDYKAQIVNAKIEIDNLGFTFDYSDKVTHRKPQTLDECLALIKDASVRLKKVTAELNSYKFENTKFQYSFNGEKAKINGQEYEAPNFPRFDLTSFDTDSNYKKLVINIYSILSELLGYLEIAINYFGGDQYKNYVEARAKQVSAKYTSDFVDEMDDKISTNYNRAADYLFNSCLPVLKANVENLEDHQSIDTLLIPYEFSSKLNIGGVEVELSNFKAYSKFIEQFDSEGYVKDKIQCPFYLDLTQKGNVLINTDEVDGITAEFVHQLILQFVSSVPFKKICLAMVDVDDFDKFDFSMEYNKGYLRNNNLLVNGGPAVDEESFKQMINALVSKINHIKGDKLSPSDCSNVFEYNDISPQNTQELHLLVFANCPMKMDKDIANKILTLAQNSSICGMFSIIVNNTSYKDFDDYYTKEDHEEFLKRLSQRSVVFSHKPSDGDNFVCGDKVFTPNHCFKSQDIKSFFKQIEESFANEKGRNIFYLKDLVTKNNPTVSCYKEFKIPIGVKAGQTIYFRLNGKDQGLSSAIIAGGTGSGKSSLLHSIILSGAYTYSPNELEYYLVDFKQGNEFKFYKKNETMYLPHITYISANNVLEDAYDLLKKIETESMKRRDCFTAAGVVDHESYQQLPDVQSGKLPSFKRIIVIIDEYQKFLDESTTNALFLSRKCMDLLTDLLRQIRNVGISIILASQNIKLDTEAFELIHNRYMLDSSVMDIQRAFSNFNADEMLLELKKEKGLVYKSENQGAVKELFKFAYSGETNKSLQLELAKMINDKYPGIQTEQIISGNQDLVPVCEKLTPELFKQEFGQKKSKDIDCYFGVSSVSGDPVRISYNYADFCNYVIVGQFAQVRNVEASLGLSFMCACKEKGIKSDEPIVSYLDLNTKQAAKENPTPFLKYKDDFDGIVKYAYHKDCVDEISRIYEEYLRRKKESESSAAIIEQTPFLIIVNSFSDVREFSFDALSSGFSASLDDIDLEEEVTLDSFEDEPAEEAPEDDGTSPEEKLKILYKNGCFYNIYVILQDLRLAALNGDDEFVDATRVICCDLKETENCRISESGETYVLRAMDASLVVKYPDVTKVRPYVFQYNEKEKNCIAKITKELKTC